MKEYFNAINKMVVKMDQTAFDEFTEGNLNALHLGVTIDGVRFMITMDKTSEEK